MQVCKKHLVIHKILSDSQSSFPVGLSALLAET